VWTRFFPAVLKMQELMANGTIGDIKLVQANFGMQPPGRVDRLYNPELGKYSKLSNITFSSTFLFCTFLRC